MTSPTKDRSLQSSWPSPAAATLLFVVVAAALLLLATQRAVYLGPVAAPTTGRHWPALPLVGERGSTMAEALRGCTSFECLRAAHALPRGGASFNFPHFIIPGFPKCATSSLAAHLAQHPQALGTDPKEPRFFNALGNCLHADAGVTWRCDPALEQQYLLRTLRRDDVLDSGLSRAAFEATTEYSWASPEVVMGIRRELPWLKLVVSMREPISTEISGRLHRMEALGWEEIPDWFAEEFGDECLNRLRKRQGASMHECLQQKLSTKLPGHQFDYSALLATWLHAFPREQIYVMQTENLTHPEALPDLKRFLGLDPTLGPPTLSRENSNREISAVTQKAAPVADGWPMRRDEYLELVKMARAASKRLADMLEQQGYAGGEQWLAAWEAAWHRNLERCDAAGDCLIHTT